MRKAPAEDFFTRVKSMASGGGAARQEVRDILAEGIDARPEEEQLSG